MAVGLNRCLLKGRFSGRKNDPAIRPRATLYELLRTFPWSAVPTSFIQIPGRYFTSRVTWVDEAAMRIYVTYNGHLMRLPSAVGQGASGK